MVMQGLRLPGIDQELVVYPQSHPVGDADVEGVDLAVTWNDGPRPARREMFSRQTWRGCGLTPVEIDCRVLPNEGQGRQVLIAEILPLQACPAAGRQSGQRRREGGSRDCGRWHRGRHQADL